MKHRIATIALVTAALAATPVASANAREWHRWHGGGGWPLFGVIAGVTGAAVALATLPAAIVAAPPPPPPAPVYYAPPAPVYYSYRPVYARRVVYYGAPYYAYPGYYPY